MTIYEFFGTVSYYGGQISEKDDGSFLVLVPQRKLQDFASYIELHYREICDALRSDKLADIFWQSILLTS